MDERTEQNAARRTGGAEGFGSYIRRKRQEAGLTQRALAELLFVSESAVSKWERDLSYPDVSLIPDICRELHISEHAFFAACDDAPSPAERQARHWQRLVRGWRWFFGISYAAAAGICLLCDLFMDSGLDWSLIVISALALAFCVTNLPFLAKRETAAVCLGCGSGALMLLLLACWNYTGGRWILGGLAIAWVSLLLPWSLYALRRFARRYRAALAAGIFTLWVYALLAVIWLFTGGMWLCDIALPLTTVCLLFGWAVLAAVQWVPGNRWCRGVMLAALVALSIPVGNTLPRWMGLPGAEDISFAAYLDPRLPLEGWEIADRYTCYLLLAVAAALLVVGLIRLRRVRDKAAA